MKRILALVCLPFIFAACIDSSQQQVPIKEVKEILLAESRLPVLELKGSFEFYSARQSPTLELTQSSNFKGMVDFATGHYDYQFTEYKRSVLNGPEPYRTGDLRIQHDGNLSRFTEVPPNWTRPVVEIRGGIPNMFLESQDQLAFPLFAPLSVSQVAGPHISFKDMLGKDLPKYLSIATRRENNLLIVTAIYPNKSDEFQFDPSKNYAMTARLTKMKLVGSPKERDMENVYQFSEFDQTDGFWFPKSAEIQQIIDGKVEGKRVFRISEAKVLKEPVDLTFDPREP